MQWGTFGPLPPLRPLPDVVTEPIEGTEMATLRGRVASLEGRIANLENVIRDRRARVDETPERG
jgi:hypothetical protein